MALTDQDVKLLALSTEELLSVVGVQQVRIYRLEREVAALTKALADQKRKTGFVARNTKCRQQ